MGLLSLKRKAFLKEFCKLMDAFLEGMGVATCEEQDWSALYPPWSVITHPRRQEIKKWTVSNGWEPACTTKSAFNSDVSPLLFPLQPPKGTRKGGSLKLWRDTLHSNRGDSVGDCKSRECSLAFKDSTPNPCILWPNSWVVYFTACDSECRFQSFLILVSVSYIPPLA